MEVKTKKNGSTATMKVSGPLTIEHAAELKIYISNVPGDTEEIVVDLDDVTDIDLSCIQLLCSASHWFDKTRKRLIQKNVPTEIITHALSEAGYAGEMECPGKPCIKCFWKGEER